MTHEVMPHRHKLKVRFYELDPYGHLNHSVFVQYFETSRIELLEKADVSLNVYADIGYHFVVTRIETSFIRPVKAGDILTIETELLQLRPASLIWNQKMLRGAETVAHQKLRNAITDLQGKPLRVPKDVTKKLLPFAALQ